MLALKRKSTLELPDVDEDALVVAERDKLNRLTADAELLAAQITVQRRDASYNVEDAGALALLDGADAPTHDPAHEAAERLATTRRAIELQHERLAAARREATLRLSGEFRPRWNEAAATFLAALLKVGQEAERLHELNVRAEACGAKWPHLEMWAWRLGHSGTEANALQRAVERLRECGVTAGDAK